MRLIPDKLTPLTLETVIEAFALAHEKCMGALPSATTLACLVAQSALETGYWKSMHNFAFGNAKAGANWDGLVSNFGCDEIFDVATANQAKRLGPCLLQPKADGTVRVVLFEGHPWANFQAFETAADGAFEQVKLIATRERYKRAWHEACAGNAYSFARCAGEAGYYTAPIATYSAAVQSIHNRILPACSSYLAGDGHAVTEADREYISGLVYATLREYRDTDPSELAPEVA